MSGDVSKVNARVAVRGTRDMQRRFALLRFALLATRKAEATDKVSRVGICWLIFGAALGESTTIAGKGGAAGKARPGGDLFRLGGNMEEVVGTS
ncbi:hypothetical protein Dda_3558 [Drechslerella dactyloides]|uniref:Uncharacterized protein n=1 Tax=Drechslerella dactyloides TaxID=74499 RepID=A0AAD6IZ03_DREDA|nr:hypothetical protein Dda_3558 [Drechslerella dactyloides]